MHDADYLIVGAGAAGLTVAYELKKQGVAVLALEARDRVGGRTWSGTLAGAVESGQRAAAEVLSAGP